MVAGGGGGRGWLSYRSDLLLCFLHVQAAVERITSVIRDGGKEKEALPLAATFRGARWDNFKVKKLKRCRLRTALRGSAPGGWGDVTL